MFAALLFACLTIPSVDEHGDAQASSTTVVCFGDSITKHGYPKILGQILGVETVNAGVGGNTTAQALRRMSTDVLAHEPAVVVILFGTNDSRLDNAKVHVPIEDYRSNLKQMIATCVEHDSRVVLCTIPPINPTAYFTRHRKADFEPAGGLDKVLESYRSTARQVASDLRVSTVDLSRLLAEEPKWMSADGVHPTPEGDRIIAEHIAEAVATLLHEPRCSPHSPAEHKGGQASHSR